MSRAPMCRTTCAALAATVIARALLLIVASAASAQNAPSTLPGPSSGATTSYGARFDDARRFLANGQPKQALVVSERAIRSDGERYEAHVLAAAALRDQKEFGKAAAHLGTALAQAPETVRPAILRALTEVRVAGLAPDARRRLDAVMLVVNDAAKATAGDRARLLREFMTRSTALLEHHPFIADLWQLRAAAALELDYREMGVIAKYQLDQLGASSNDPPIRRIIAQMERKGWFTESSPRLDVPDPETAKRWRYEAERGDAVRQLTIGVFLRSYGSDIQKKEAVQWLMKAAEQGSAVASWNLFSIHFESAESRLTSVGWLVKAANLGLNEAQSTLASYYSDGVHGLPRDLGEAARWYRKAAAQDDYSGQFFLARAYRRGEGVNRNVDEALHWYRTAARTSLKPNARLLPEEREDLALSFAADPDPKFRDGALALRLVKVSCEESSCKAPFSLVVLAAAYAEIGDWSKAVATQQKALDLLRSYPENQDKYPEDIADFENRLQQYRNRQPFRRPRE